MKCPSCLALNCDADKICFSCRNPLAPARRAAAQEQLKAATPQWGYFFAAVCGAIPIVTLGGAVPAVLGIGGAALCLKTARTYSVATAVRFLVCVGITAVCWLLLFTLMVEFNPTAKKNLHKLIGKTTTSAVTAA